MTRYAMNEDLVIGDGGGVTIYERPDRSRYALDPEGRGHELCWARGCSGRPGSTPRARRRAVARLASRSAMAARA